MDDQTVRDALRDVMDPEIGANVVDLGLVERVDVEDRAITVELAVTSPACPMGDMLIADARTALRRRFPDAESIEVRLVRDADWTPERMTPELRARFGWQ